jgi:hypothetical protein
MARRCHFRRHGNLSNQGSEHEENSQRNTRRHCRVRAALGVRSNRYTRHEQFGYVQIDGGQSTLVVLAGWLRMYARWSGRDLLARPGVHQLRHLPPGAMVGFVPE